MCYPGLIAYSMQQRWTSLAGVGPPEKSNDLGSDNDHSYLREHPGSPPWKRSRSLRLFWLFNNTIRLFISLFYVTSSVMLSFIIYFIIL